MKHVLVASLGLVPQVITEALWAFLHPQKLIDPAHRNREAIVLQEIVLVSTTAFRQPQYASTEERDQQIRERISELYRQYGFEAPSIDIQKLSDEERLGPEKWLKDIRTQRENAVYSNHVIRLVKGLSEQEGTVIHMLLAGGRKTMSSYDHAAMMFFGRAQDSLSHVLVEPMALEAKRDFWWPDQPFAAKNAKGEEVSTSSDVAQIDLVDVPFPRLGVRLPAGVPAEALDARLISEFVEFEVRKEPIILDATDMSLTIGREKIRFTSAGYFCMVAVCAVARKQNWRGAGPETVGIGDNATGWIKLDDMRYGLRDDGEQRVTPALRFLRQLATRIRDSRGWTAKGDNKDFAWIDNVNKSGAGDGDPISSLRTRTNDFLKAKISSPFIAHAAILSAYGRVSGHARGTTGVGQRVVGLQIAPERIVLKGFTDTELDAGNG